MTATVKLSEKMNDCKSISDFCKSCGIDFIKEAEVLDRHLDNDPLIVVVIANHALNVLHKSYVPADWTPAYKANFSYVAAHRLIELINSFTTHHLYKSSFPNGYKINTDAYHLIDQSDFNHSCENAIEYALAMMVKDLMGQEQTSFIVPEGQQDLNKADQITIIQNLGEAIHTFGLECVQRYTKKLFVYEDETTGEIKPLPFVTTYFKGQQSFVGG